VGPVALIIAWAGSLTGTHVIIAAGLVYTASVIFAFFYNLTHIRSVLLALSTALLQQVAVLGTVLFLIYFSPVCRFMRESTPSISRR
jgi:hypothetical protein